jgi:hypothetical protein
MGDGAAFLGALVFLMVLVFLVVVVVVSVAGWLEGAV